MLLSSCFIGRRIRVAGPEDEVVIYIDIAGTEDFRQFQGADCSWGQRKPQGISGTSMRKLIISRQVKMGILSYFRIDHIMV